MTSTGVGKYGTFVLPANFDRRSPQSMNGILNNEHGVSDVITSNPARPKVFTVGSLDHQDEACYLHMTPSSNSTLNYMQPAGVRDIVRRIPLGATYPNQNHDTLMAHDADFLNL